MANISQSVKTALQNKAKKVVYLMELWSKFTKEVKLLI